MVSITSSKSMVGVASSLFIILQSRKTGADTYTRYFTTLVSSKLDFSSDMYFLIVLASVVVNLEWTRGPIFITT